MSSVVILMTAALAGQQSQISWSSRLAADPALSSKERVRLLFHNAFFSTAPVARNVGSALAGQVANTPKEWGRTGEGFGRRTGLYYAMFASQDLMTAAAGAARGRDPRYQRCDCKGTMRRARHALAGIVRSADSNGVLRFDPAPLGSDFAAGYVGASLYPSNYRVRTKGYQLGSLQAAQTIGDNLLQEFGPEIRRLVKKVLRR